MMTPRLPHTYTQMFDSPIARSSRFADGGSWNVNETRATSSSGCSVSASVALVAECVARVAARSKPSPASGDARSSRTAVQCVVSIAHLAKASPSIKRKCDSLSHELASGPTASVASWSTAPEASVARIVTSPRASRVTRSKEQPDAGLRSASASHWPSVLKPTKRPPPGMPRTVPSSCHCPGSSSEMPGTTPTALPRKRTPSAS
mmetsp:Transcript_33437/g.83482  ORF Transcript_33437/g.83482 Transcript_33437/m.83482 type:complete len:205 (+) Transcript_33437:1011-1625(+)